MDSKSIYRTEVEAELDHILDFWIQNTFDHVHGGFIGKMDQGGIVHPDAPKGLVLNARILWTFSAAYRRSGKKPHLEAAKRAFEALVPFMDTTYGGYYWAVSPDGVPLETRKQIYGLAFALYGLSEYYQIDCSESVKSVCIAIFDWIEKQSYTPHNRGYLEACARDGSPLADMRLSPKDRNDPLTMNTHLHILEAYTNLYRIWKSDHLKKQGQNLIDLFLSRIIDPKTKHLILFFDDQWSPTDADVSYGHDIEAAWLVLEAAEVFEHRIEEAKKTAIEIAQAVAPALHPDGGLDYEEHRKERHWWVQAEAMVGFLNAYQLSGEALFLDYSMAAWDYVVKHFIDPIHGEWYWGYDVNGKLMQGEDKVGFWKCPYHNARACMEVSKRVSMN